MHSADSARVGFQIGAQNDRQETLGDHPLPSLSAALMKSLTSCGWVGVGAVPESEVGHSGDFGGGDGGGAVVVVLADFEAGRQRTW